MNLIFTLKSKNLIIFTLILFCRRLDEDLPSAGLEISAALEEKQEQQSRKDVSSFLF